MRLFAISFPIALLFIALPAVAEEEVKEVTKLDTVVVTATKKEATLLETPVVISIITAEDIEKSGQKDLGAIIASVPGIINQSTGSDIVLSFRGTRGYMLGGPIVLVDGAPWNFGIYDYNHLERIPLERIERIEIIKSPPPSIYGTNASRGVINIITRKGKYAEEPVQITISGGIGAWETYKSFIAVLGKRNQWDYNLSGSYKESEGYRHLDPQSKVFAGVLGYEFDEGLRLEADINWSDYFSKRGTALKHWVLEDRRQNDPPDAQTGSTYRIRPDERDEEILNGDLRFNYAKDNWLFNSALYLSHLDEISDSLRYYNSSALRKNCYRYDKDEDRVGGNVSGGYTFYIEESLTDTITLGYDFSRELFDQTRSYPYAFILTASQETSIKKAAIDGQKDIHSIFVNNEFKYGSFGLLAGLRYDIAKYDLENEVPQSVKKEFKELGWNIAPSYSFTPNNNLFFSSCKSYWYPAMYYIKSALENDYADNKPEDLEPEEDMTYEIGFKHRFMKAFNYNFSLFYTEIENKYMSYYDDTGTFQGYKPVGTSIHKGVDLEVDGKPFEWLGYRLGFCWLDAEWDQARTKVRKYGATPAGDTYEVMDISGKELYHVPEYTYNVGLDFYPLKSWQFSVALHGFGEQHIDALNRYKNKAVNLVDTKLTYSLKNWKFHIAGSNIFDIDYEHIYNATGKRNNDGTADHYYYPRDGRYVEAGASFKF